MSTANKDVLAQARDNYLSNLKHKCLELQRLML